ncbi:hypothetical protein J4E90_007248 [Alternaria incomplexa]|uniref:uncharacterized protein n=1 Tax=Alternaria incomplexa TaxID=1187928 RepID=UPI00221E5C43|nr:uncharacterized protein J4E90_007248 [Alternaria incomplexa]KAI4910991.1 hypothetical protein J4E90_007248 [Alternaria incomplexa]
MKQKTLEWAGHPADWCTTCMGELPETHEDLPFGFLTLPSEPAMNAAGRTSDHPFKDVRSARRVRQRSKRYPERIYSGNKRRRNDRYRLARENQLRHESKQADIREWEDDCYDRWAHEVDMEHMDDIKAYELFGKNAHVFEGTATGDIITGEDFGTWARRRIAEMRRVKEHRIHTYGGPTSPAPLAILPHTMRDTRRPGREEKLDEYDQGWDSDLSDWGHHWQDDYVILEEEQEESETWSIVSGVDQDCFDDHDLEQVDQTT